MGTQRYGIVWSVKHLYAKAKPSRELIGKGIAQQGKAMKWHSGATQRKGTVKRSRDEQRHCKAFISQGIAWNSIDKNGGCETSAPKIKKLKEIFEMKEIKVKLTFTEEILGTAPSDPEIYKKYIASKSEDAVKIDEEVATIGVDEVVNNARTIFSKNKDGELILWDYQIKGFFKDAIGMLRQVKGTKASKLTAYKKKVDGLVFVQPRQIEFENVIDIGDCQRPLRASTAQGERIAIAVSDTINAGATLTFTITLLNEDLEDVVIECLDYGKLRGLGQWRNSGKGTFTYEIL